MFPHLVTPPGVTVRRRERLMNQLDGGAALFASGRPPVRSHTIRYPFRADSDFYYLAGLREQEAALLLLSGPNGHRSIAFVRPRDPLAEAWEGRRLGVERAAEALGVDEAYPIDELPRRLPGLLRGHRTLCYPLGRDRELDAVVIDLVGAPQARVDATPATLVHPRAVLHELRLVKEPHEVARMREAAAVTAAGFEAARSAIAAGGGEREVRAAIEGTFGRLGADGPAYGTIVAGGPNATVLHYPEADMPLAPGDLVLIDAGAEVAGYACDVTRTYAVSGEMTPVQAQVHGIVREAQRAAIAALRAGTPVTDYHRISDERLTAGLVELGVLVGAVDELVAAGAHRRYTLHRAGHFLGLDTHDVGEIAPYGQPRPLEAGMVLTVEPGLYFPADDLALDPDLRGLGVRLEDDVLVTADAPEVLTAAIPFQA